MTRLKKSIEGGGERFGGGGWWGHGDNFDLRRFGGIGQEGDDESEEW